MNPPFSSKPINAFVSTILRDTSTLPTLVRITCELNSFATSSMPEPEFKQVTTRELGFFCKINFASTSADLSPLSISPLSSQKILRSPSPSKAIPRSALFCKTVLESPERFCGVGSQPLPGNKPTPQNLSELSITVLQNNADLGIAFDGDGDRSIFCDNNREILTGDKSALVLTKFILEKNPNSLVVTCLNSGSNIEVIANEFNSQVIRTKVGSVEVSRKMVPTNALI